MPVKKIQMKRGLQVDLPSLDVAEIGFTTDAFRTYIGSASGNVELAKKADIAAAIAAIPTKTDREVNVLDFGAKGDGITDDTDAIQAAVTYAWTKGIRGVYFPPPLVAFMVNGSKPIIVPDRMKIIGVKGQSIVRLIPNSLIKSADVYWGGVDSIFVPGTIGDRKAFTKDAFGRNILFDGLVLDGNCQNMNQVGYDKTVSSSGLHCLYVKVLTIRDCEVMNFLNSGIYEYGCTMVKIYHNDVHHNGLFEYNADNGYNYANGVSRNGISLAGGYLPGQTTEETPYSFDYEITGNNVHDNVDEGIMFAYQRRLLIAHNFVHDNGDMGIEGDSGYTTTDTMPDVPGNVIPGDVIITDNFIYDHPHSAISINSSNQMKIRINNNQVRNCGRWGVFVAQNNNSSTIVADNTIYNYGTLIDGTQYHGVYIEGTHVKVQDNFVYAPTFDITLGASGGTSSGAGIVVSRADDLTIQDNTVLGGGIEGIIIDIWRMSQTGETMKTLKIDGNTVKYAHKRGIYISADLSTRMQQVSINNNNIFDYQTGYDYTSGTGYTLFSGIEFGANTRITSLTITGNTVMNEVDQTIVTSTGLPLGKIPGQYAINLPTLAGSIINCVIGANELAYGGQFAPFNNSDKPQFVTLSGNSAFGSRIFYGTAAPTSSSLNYYVGDRMKNSAPTVGGVNEWVCVTAGKPGTWIEAGYVKAHRLAQKVLSGDGTTTVFSFAHGLTGTPLVLAVPVSLDCANAVILRVGADTTNVIITFKTAPISGTNNVTLNYVVEV